nr:MAG TPA: DNA repair protein REV1 [Caudoviricetes sp.]
MGVSPPQRSEVLSTLLTATIETFNYQWLGYLGGINNRLWPFRKRQRNYTQVPNGTRCVPCRSAVACDISQAQ